MGSELKGFEFFVFCFCFRFSLLRLFMRQLQYDFLSHPSILPFSYPYPVLKRKIKNFYRYLVVIHPLLTVSLSR